LSGEPICFPASHLLTSHIDKPNEDPNVRGDAFKTLIVARLSYEADERDLEKEFGRFGPIERVCSRHDSMIRTSTNIITDQNCYRYSRS
jgi:RNA recognition motif-containing protein